MFAVSLPDLRTITRHLFIEESFDSFPLYEAMFQTRSTFTIDGWRNTDYFTSEENESETESYVRWKELKPIAYTIIKGKKLPLRFKIVLRAPKNVVCDLLEKSDLTLTEEQVESLHMIFTYKDDRLICTTGTSLRIFTMDKSLDHLWDEYVLKFFDQFEIKVQYPDGYQR